MTPSDKLSGRKLYLCTPDRPDLAHFLTAGIDGGVDIVQLREKHLEARALLQRAEIAAEVCRSRGVPFILNDRPDLALACGADGVHVGQGDVPPVVARGVLGENAIVGFSTHSRTELDASRREPVDYVSVGPVEPTPTKPGRPGTGLDYVEYAAANEQRPWFVTGGVNPDTVAGLIGAGARRFVVVRWLTESSDPSAAAAQLLQAIDRTQP